MGKREKHRKDRSDPALIRNIRINAAAAAGLILIDVLAHMLVPTEGVAGVLNKIAVDLLTPLCVISFLLITVYIWMSYRFTRQTGESFVGLRTDKRYNMTRRELAEFHKRSDPHKLDVTSLPTKKWYDSGGIVLGHIGDRLIEVPPGSQINVAVIGKPKSGKSVIILDSIMSMLYAQSKTSFCAVDLKGDLTSAVRDFNKKMLAAGKKVGRLKVFSPSDPVKSAHYDPLSLIRGRSLDEAKPVVRAMAQMLVPLPAQGGNASYFAEVAQNFFCGIALYILFRDPQVSFPEIVINILHGKFKKWVKACNEPWTPLEVSEFLSRYEDENEINVGGGYNTLCRSLQDLNTESLQELLRPAPDAISVRDLERGTNIFLRVSQNEMAQYGKLLGLIFDLFMLELMDRPEMRDRPSQREIWLILDEFARLGRLDSVAAAAATTRSKGVTLLFGFQSLAPLQQDSMYGEKGTDELLDCCSAFAITQLTSPRSQEWASKLIGGKKVLNVSYSDSPSSDKLTSSVSRTSREEYEPIFRPEDFGDPSARPEDLKVTVVLNGKYVRADIIRHWEDMPL